MFEDVSWHKCSGKICWEFLKQNFYAYRDRTKLVKGRICSSPVDISSYRAIVQPLSLSYYSFNFYSVSILNPPHPQIISITCISKIYQIQYIIYLISLIHKLWRFPETFTSDIHTVHTERWTDVDILYQNTPHPAQVI